MKRSVVVASLVALSWPSFAFAGQQPSAPSATAEPARGEGRQGGRQGRSNAETAAPAFKKLTRAELDGLLKDPGKVLILDVRRPDEIQSIGGFPAYLSIQLADLEKYVAFIPKDRAIVTVSNHSGRAGRAIPVLEKHGLKIAGGIGAQDYESEGGTLVKVAAPASTDSTTSSATTAKPAEGARQASGGAR